MFYFYRESPHTMKIYLPSDVFDEESVEINVSDKNIIKVFAKIITVDEKPFIEPIEVPPTENSTTTFEGSENYIPFSEF